VAQASVLTSAMMASGVSPVALEEEEVVELPCLVVGVVVACLVAARQRKRAE